MTRGTAVAAVLAVATVVSGCTASEGRADVLRSLDAPGYELCLPATSDGSATFALSRVVNDSDATVAKLDRVDLLDGAQGLAPVGAYFAPPDDPGVASGPPFEPPTDTHRIRPGEEAVVAIGLELDAAERGTAPGVTVHYTTEDGGGGSVTTRIVMVMVDTASC